MFHLYIFLFLHQLFQEGKSDQFDWSETKASIGLPLASGRMGPQSVRKSFTTWIPLPRQGYLCGPCPLGLGQLRCPQWDTGSLGVWCPLGSQLSLSTVPCLQPRFCLPLLPMQIWFSVRSQDWKTGKKQEALCLSLEFHSLIQYLPGSLVLPLCVYVCVCVCVCKRERREKERRWNEDGLSVLPSVSDTLIYFFYCSAC